MFEIKHRYAGEVLYRSDVAENVKAAVEAAARVGARLDGASLDGASLVGARLDGARLEGARLPWQSHDMIAELLRRAAGEDVDRRMVAGLVLVSRDWCWRQFLSIDRPLRAWALEVLAGHVQPDDKPPAEVRALAEAKAKAAEVPAGERSPA